MSIGVREQLQATLGGAYTIERELGGGGMSRVFVAEETRLGRRVVVKVLDPEFAAGLLMDRFEREVRLAAQLQDPHIVPLLAAGVTDDGLPYYTMPFVEGESLRARLAGAPGGLPLDEAASILRDVAIALEAAHAHGVVHRDVKPENVLLSGRTAVVTDFGIAKAIATSRTAAGATLTTAGTSLGTPAYMAPEQAAGDDADARADIYTWGVLAYELLAGVHPFAGKTTAARLIAAHLGETPPPLARAAPRVPAALAALVMRCLAKDPAERPASAGELVTALGTWAGATAARRRWWPRVVAATTVALAVLAVLAAGAWLLTPAELRATLRTLATRPPPTLRVNRVVVAPFRDETGDPKLAALGALAADYLTDGLSRLGSLQVVDARTAAATNEVVSRIPRLFRAGDERALGEETGAKVVVAGSYYLDGDSVLFRARILDAASGAVRTALEPVSAPLASPARGVAALSARVVAALRAASDEDASDLAGLSAPPSLAAYTAFREGFDAFLQGKSDASVFQPMWRAMALDTTYGAPAVVLAALASLRNDHTTADSALTRAGRLRDHLTPQERAIADVVEAKAEGDVGATFEAARHTGMPQLAAYYALGARRPRAAIAALTSTDPDRGLNLALAGWYWLSLAAAHAQLGEYDRALAVAREGERRAPALRGATEEVIVAAARGDVRGVRDAVEARWRAGEPPLFLAALATTLLRERGGRDAEGLALATRWAEPMLRAANEVPAPNELAFWGRNDGVLFLLDAAERWGDLLRVTETDDARLSADSASRATSTGLAVVLRQRLRMCRAVALIHLGRRAEALAIDSAFARAASPRWDFSAMPRAVIAAHLGETDRAISLVTKMVAQGFLLGGAGNDGYGAIDAWPPLLPLRADPRFRALARPDPADEVGR